MPKEARKASVEAIEEKALKAAIDRVYQKYGTDLRAFFRDVHQELATKRQESPRKREYAR